MTKKRSFFERLTGIGTDDEPVEIELTPSSARRDTLGKNPLPTDLEKKGGWVEDPGEGELAVDVYQTDEEIIVRAMVAGVKPDHLDIAITRDMVTIKGSREVSEEIRDDHYFFRELYWGSFSRTILLPQEVEAEEAEATERNGLLTIRLPKIDKGRQMKLKVKSSA